MFGPSLLFYPLFEGLPDVNTTYFMFMVVVLTDVLRWAPLIPLLMLECCPVGLTYLETNPLIVLIYDMECDVEMLMTIVNQWLLVRTPPDGPDVSNPFLYIALYCFECIVNRLEAHRIVNVTDWSSSKEGPMGNDYYVDKCLMCKARPVRLDCEMECTPVR